MDDYKDNEGTADQVGAIQQQNDPGTTSKKSAEKNIDSDDRDTIEEVSTEKKKRNEVKNNITMIEIIMIYAVQSVSEYI